MTYEIFHKTEFRYQHQVSFSHNIARLKPVDNMAQKLIDFSLSVEPQVYESREFVDFFGNTNYHLLIRKSHNTLSVTGRSKVTILQDYTSRHIESCRQNSITYNEALQRLSRFDIRDINSKPFLFESELIPKSSQAIQAYARESFYSGRDLFEAGLELTERIFKDFEFVTEFSDITTPVEEIFKAKKGVCQDFAQLAISALRSIGLPARYVSGYIETQPPEGKEKLFGTDASHAWFSLYIPGVGWVDFDPTNNLIPLDQHIVLGYGKDYNDISPLKGVVRSSGESRLSVMVDVQRVD